MAERERNGSPPLGRQKSAGSIGSHLPTPAPSLHVRSVSQPHAGAALNSVKKSQNNAAKAAAARLAQVMQANRDSNNDDDEEDVPLPRYSSYLSNARDATRDQPPQVHSHLCNQLVIIELKLLVKRFVSEGSPLCEPS